ncbi:DUF192 domain-containing protein [Candidatus Woesearchaeota archaeon]|nr:DUF192 domain-containing protein [Candidatus Woesearchaeota archaeon]
MKIPLFAPVHRGMFWLFFFLLACSSPYVAINEQRIAVEIADEPNEWQRGLQNRTFLAQDTGMLFVFPEPKEVTFWMKDTLIPLDMLFIDENGVIQFIRHDVKPCKADPCQTYAHQNIKYVLELPGTYAELKGFKTGDKLQILW